MACTRRSITGKYNHNASFIFVLQPDFSFAGKIKHKYEKKTTLI